MSTARNAHPDAAIGSACERLQDWPIGQHIGRHVDFVLGAIDYRNVRFAKDRALPLISSGRF